MKKAMAIRAKTDNVSVYINACRELCLKAYWNKMMPLHVRFSSGLGNKGLMLTVILTDEVGPNDCLALYDLTVSAK